MYSNSFSHIKLSGHLSNRIQILKGTEQGHPLSPDLFKIFISDLSPLLEINDCPKLSHMPISHLLWADDLIMLSLTPESSQQQINKLEQFCNDWGIEINEIKTQAMVFRHNHLNISNLELNLYGKPLEIVDTYCYLGIELHYSGELRTAQESLKIKAMSAFFGLKRTIIRSKLSFKALVTLFDSLIKPIVLYGAPIWTLLSSVIKFIHKYQEITSKTFQNFIAKINCVTSEKVHLSFLKWALGVHRKASNVGVWGETGRYPLIYQSIRLTLNYYNRISKSPKNSFVYAALMEQKHMKLPWYKNIENILKLDDIYHIDHVTAHQAILSPNIKVSAKPQTTRHPIESLKSLSKVSPIPSKKFRVQSIIHVLSDHFIKCWEHEKSISSKLSFYHKIKTKFGR